MTCLTLTDTPRCSRNRSISSLVGAVAGNFGSYFVFQIAPAASKCLRSSVSWFPQGHFDVGVTSALVALFSGCAGCFGSDVFATRGKRSASAYPLPSDHSRNFARCTLVRLSKVRGSSPYPLKASGSSTEWMARLAPAQLRATASISLKSAPNEALALAQVAPSGECLVAMATACQSSTTSDLPHLSQLTGSTGKQSGILSSIFRENAPKAFSSTTAYSILLFCDLLGQATTASSFRCTCDSESRNLRRYSSRNSKGMSSGEIPGSMSIETKMTCHRRASGIFPHRLQSGRL